MSLSGSTSTELNSSTAATDSNSSTFYSPPPALSGVVQKKMQKAGISDFSAMTKNQAIAFKEALKLEQSAQNSGQHSGTTKGLEKLISGLDDAIQKWQDDGDTALKTELNNQTGLQGVLAVVSEFTGSGNADSPSDIDKVLSEVNNNASALKLADQTIEKQIPYDDPQSKQTKQDVESLLLAVQSLEDAGFDLKALQLDTLKSEIDTQLKLPATIPPDLAGDNTLLRKGVLSALNNYFQSSGLPENSQQMQLNKALLASATVASEEHSMSNAWESEVRSITNLQSFDTKELETSVAQLLELKINAIQRGDPIAAAAIQAKIDILSDAQSKIEGKDVLGKEAMLIGQKLRTIDLSVKHILLDQLKAGKAEADKSGDEGLINKLEGEIASIETEIQTIDGELKLTKEKTLELIEDMTEKTMRNLQNIM